MATKIPRMLLALNIARVILVTDVHQSLYSATDNKTVPAAISAVNG